jgi:hypothetical protein
VMISDKKEVVVVHINTKRIMRYVPLEILGSSSPSFRIYSDAKRYFSQRGVCEPAGDVFKHCFGRSYLSALRRNKKM